MWDPTGLSLERPRHWFRSRSDPATPVGRVPDEGSFVYDNSFPEGGTVRWDGRLLAGHDTRKLSTLGRQIDRHRRFVSGQVSVRGTYGTSVGDSPITEYDGVGWKGCLDTRPLYPGENGIPLRVSHFLGVYPGSTLRSQVWSRWIMGPWSWVYTTQL